MAQSGGNSITLYTYFSEPDVFLETVYFKSHVWLCRKDAKTTKQRNNEDINTACVMQNNKKTNTGGVGGRKTKLWRLPLTSASNGCETVIGRWIYPTFTKDFHLCLILCLSMLSVKQWGAIPRRFVCKKRVHVLSGILDVEDNENVENKCVFDILGLNVFMK